jgi:hypothetical protein
MPYVPKSPDSARALFATVKHEKPDTIVFVRRDDGPGLCTFGDDAKRVAEVLGLPHVHAGSSDPAGYDARHQRAWIAETGEGGDSPVERLERQGYTVAVIYGVPENRQPGDMPPSPQP